MSDFFRSVMGHRFYESTMPALVRELSRLNANLEKLSEKLDAKVAEGTEGTEGTARAEGTAACAECGHALEADDCGGTTCPVCGLGYDEEEETDAVR